MIINVDGREYRVFIHNGHYIQVYSRFYVRPGMMRGCPFGKMVERKVKKNGVTWGKVVSAHRLAVGCV